MIISIEISHRKLTIRISQLGFPVLAGLAVMELIAETCTMDI